MSRETLHSQDDYLLPDHWLLPKENIWSIMHDAYVKRVVEIVVRSGAKSVLEVGCGDGWNCAQFVNAGIKATGVDLSVNGIQHASRMVPKAKFFCCDIRDEQFRSAFPELFDAVVSIEVIEHIPPDDCVEALQNIASYVKPGGILVLTTPSTNIPNNNPLHYRHFTEPILRDLVSQAGNLEVELIEGYGNAALETQYYRWARWIDNRYYTLYPLRRWMQNRYKQQCTSTPIQQCHGFILVLRRHRFALDAIANELPNQTTTTAESNTHQKLNQHSGLVFFRPSPVQLLADRKDLDGEKVASPQLQYGLN